MKFIIFGTGGVGGYFGGRLAQAGEDVTFIARGNHLRAMLDSGLRVDSILGDFSIYPARAAETPQPAPAPDVILLAVKAWQLNNAIAQIAPLVSENTVIIPLLNGMEHIDALLRAFGSAHVLGGLCRISAFIAGAGHIQHVGIEPYLAFGELDKTRSPRVESLLRVFQKASGITAEIPEDIQRAMWDKYLFICAMGGVGAVTRQPIGVTRAIPPSRALLRQALEEGAGVARARGVEFTPADVDAIMSRIDGLPPKMLASMQKDMMEGRPSELEAQNGAMTRMAKAAGAAAPLHEFIYGSLLPMEQAARNANA
ncbi:MAG: 2-dehydropantoate 2-reductase [Anaerolineales bacterium]